MTQTRSKGSILFCSLGLVLFLCGFSSCASDDSQDDIKLLVIYPKSIKCGEPRYVELFILTSDDVSSIKCDNDSTFCSKLIPKTGSMYEVMLNAVPHYVTYPSTPRTGVIGTSLDPEQRWDIEPCDVYLQGEHILSLDYTIFPEDRKQPISGSLTTKGIVVDQNRNYYFNSLFDYILKNQLQAVITLLIAIVGFVSGLVFRKSPSKHEKDD